MPESMHMEKSVCIDSDIEKYLEKSLCEKEKNIMLIKKEYDFSQFEPWSGAVDTWKRLEDAGKLDELEWLLEDIYPDGIDETALNDLLWFDDEWIYNTVGIRSESEIAKDISDKEDEMAEKMTELREAENDKQYMLDMGEFDEEELDEMDERIMEIEAELDEIVDELNELKEELNDI